MTEEALAELKFYEDLGLPVPERITPGLCFSLNHSNATAIVYQSIRLFYAFAYLLYSFMMM